LSQVVAAVQDHTQAAAQVAGSLRLQATHMEVTPAALQERSQLVTLLAQVLAERRMQAAVAAAIGAAVAALHTQVAAAVRRSRALVCTGSLTHPRLQLGLVLYKCGFLKQQRWFLLHSL
jgi:uncharacterized membrane protein